MLFSGLACFSPTVPSYIRTLWVKHGGILTHNDDDFRKANFFFCEGMEDPWVNELLSRCLIVRHAAWVVLCVVEEFLMPIADYTLDDGFDESKIRILEFKSLAIAPGAVTSTAQLQENSAPPALAPASPPASPPPRKPADGLAPPYQKTQPTNQRKRKHDDDQSGDEDNKQEVEVQDRQRPRKKAKWVGDRENALEESNMLPVKLLEGVPVAPLGLPVEVAGAGAATAAAAAAPTTRRRRRRELPFAFSTVRAAQMMIMKPTSTQVHTLMADADAKVSSEVSTREQREGKPLTRPSNSTIAGGGGGSKARKAFEKCIVRPTENRGAVAPGASRPLLPVDLNVNVNGPPPSAAASAPLNSSGKRGERASTHTNNPTLNAHTLFWNDLLARSFLKLNHNNGPYFQHQQHQNQNQNQLLELSVGDLQHAPRTKAVIFDVDKTYRGRRFINLVNEKMINE